MALNLRIADNIASFRTGPVVINYIFFIEDKQTLAAILSVKHMLLLNFFLEMAEQERYGWSP